MDSISITYSALFTKNGQNWDKTVEEHSYGSILLSQYTFFQNDHHLDNLLFLFKLDLDASFKAKYSIEF